MSLLQVRNLEVTFATADGPVHAVNGVNFDVDSGEILAIVGESGSGKSQTAFAIMGLLSRRGQASGSVKFDGREILGIPESALAGIRATEIAIIFQNPMTSLNPFMRISEQMTEVLMQHENLSKRAALDQCIRMLDAVQIPDARERIGMFPHECSGGMRQRIMTAISLLCRPRILIADEPTTALDVTVQAQIVDLLKSVRDQFGTTIILITHDLGLVAGISDRIMVMYGGQVMECGPTDVIFSAPSHPYTSALLDTIPRLDRGQEELRVIVGDPPDMLALPAGCPFQPRCPARLPKCADTRPVLETTGKRSRGCHLHCPATSQ